MIDIVRRGMVRRKAREEAGLQVDGRVRVLTETYGADPLAREKNSLRYREAVQTVAAHGVIRELEEELGHLEDFRAPIGNVHAFTAALVALTVVEFWGALQLLRAMNVPEDTRPFGAIALSLALIALTKAAATARPATVTPAPAPTEASDTEEGTEAPAPAPAPFDWKALLVPGLYTLFIAGIAAARLGTQDPEEATTLFSFSDAILTVATTAGPAWLAAHVARRRAPALELARRISLLSTRLTRARRKEAAAKRYLQRLDARSVAHADAVLRTDAAYSLEHERAQAAARVVAEVEPIEP